MVAVCLFAFYGLKLIIVLMKTKLTLVFAFLFALSLSVYAQGDFARGNYSFDRIRPEFTIWQTISFDTHSRCQCQ